MNAPDTRREKMVARRNLDRADNALAEALLNPRVRAMVPQVPATCQFTGRLSTTDHEAWQNVYYGRTAKHIAAFRKAMPEIAARIPAELDAVVAAQAAYEVARKADKAALEARRTVRAAKATEKAVNPARPLASVNPLAAANYDALSTLFASRRAEYVAAYVAAVVRQSGGQVMRNVNEEIEAACGGMVFDRYMAKLATKITARIASGTLTGSLWNWSLLTVETDSGQQTWKTRCIMNISVLKNTFNQWPTRRIS